MNRAAKFRSMGSTLLRASAVFVLLVIGIGLGIVLLCGLLLRSLASELCGSEVFQEIDSPNGKYKAVVFQRDCGATTGFGTHIAILKSTASLGERTGNVFQARGHPDWFEIEVEWRDDTHLIIEHNGKPVPGVTESKVYGIEIQYIENAEGVVPPRPFQPNELLLPVSFFPQGWTGEELRPYGPEEIRGSKENNPYVLYTPQVSGYHEAGHYVTRTDNSENAARAFERELVALQDHYPRSSTPFGAPLPDEISFRSSFTENFAVFCTEHQYGASGDPRCKMVAQYEEFFIRFEATVVTENGLTYEQFNGLIEVVDQITVRHLQ